MMWIAGFVYLFLANMIFVVHPHPQQADAVACLGYFKCAITFLKYCPQVYWNYLRKTTKGWNMFNIYCDFSGGLCAMVQIVFDAKRKTGSLDVFTGGLNITKFSLSICSLCFDTIFLIQHFVLYKDREPKHNFDENLLDTNGNNEKQKLDM